jgi:hypothetical protein
MEQSILKTKKTYELRNLLLVLLDKNTGTMTDFEFDLHEACKASIRKELEERRAK